MAGGLLMRPARTGRRIEDLEFGPEIGAAAAAAGPSGQSAFQRVSRLQEPHGMCRCAIFRNLNKPLPVFSPIREARLLPGISRARDVFASGGCVIPLHASKLGGNVLCNIDMTRTSYYALFVAICN